jgi:hypothetical protein
MYSNNNSGAEKTSSEKWRITVAFAVALVYVFISKAIG